MPTVIDSLVVELGLDARKFTKEQQEAINRAKRANADLEKSVGGLERQATNAGFSFAKLQNQVVGALTAFTVGRGIQEVTTRLAQNDAQVARTARTYGLSAKEIETWRAAITASGGSAEGVTASMTRVTEELEKQAATGDSSVIPFYQAMSVRMVDMTGRARSYRDVLFDMAKWAETQTPERAAHFMRGAGIDEGSINLALQGTRALTGYYDAAKKVVNVNKETSDSAEQVVGAWNRLLTASDALMRSMNVYGGISKFMDTLGDVFTHFSQGKIPEGSFVDVVMKRLGGDKNAVNQLWKNPVVQPTIGGSVDGKDPFERDASGRYKNPQAAEAAIRAKATSRGIDPDVAMNVARREGFGNFQSSIVKNGVREKSYGAYQLYTGGGLGNEFQKKTGLDPSDPRNEGAGVDYALDHVRQNGWGKFHGAANNGIGNWAGVPMPGALSGGGNSSTRTTTVNINKLEVVTQATDAPGIARTLPAAIERQGMVGQADTGYN